MNRDAGELVEGEYPEGSVNALTLARLKQIADVVSGDNEKEETEQDKE